MVDFKLVIGTKDGKCVQKEVKDADVFLGKKIGDTVPGEAIDAQGWEFQITGGSDECGFPMRWDIEGTHRKRILTAKSKGAMKLKFKGQRKRKTLCGNTIHPKISQINVKVTKQGSEPLSKAPAEEKSE